MGLRWLTIDLVPSSRWSEPLGAVRALLVDVERVVLARRDAWHVRGVRVRGIGRRDERLPRRLRRGLDDTQALPPGHHGGTLTPGGDQDGGAAPAPATAGSAAE